MCRVGHQTLLCHTSVDSIIPHVALRSSTAFILDTFADRPAILVVDRFNLGQRSLKWSEAPQWKHLRVPLTFTGVNRPPLFDFGAAFEPNFCDGPGGLYWPAPALVTFWHIAKAWGLLLLLWHAEYLSITSDKLSTSSQPRSVAFSTDNTCRRHASDSELLTIQYNTI